MIIVTSLAGASGAFEMHRPSRVISLLSGGETMPQFEGLSPAQHLQLRVEHLGRAAAMGANADSAAHAIIDFLGAWRGDEDLLIHCNRGVARSMAVAFIAMCIARPDESEARLAKELRAAAPHADPDLLLIASADDLLERDGRMLDEIEELCAPCTDIAAPAVTLPLAAS